MERPVRTILSITSAAIVAIAIGTFLRGSSLQLFAKPLAWVNGVRVAITSSATSLTQIGQLRSEREQLQKEVTDLRQQLSDNSQITRENESLRKELGATSTNRDLPKVVAQVIAQTGSIIDRGFLISAGKNQGIASGQPVISNGYLIGRVTNVDANVAEVRSVTSSKSIIQAWISSTGAKGLLQGDGNTVSFDKIEQGQIIPENAVLETSGLGGSLPRGILLGIASEKISNDTKLSQSFRVTLGTNPNDATTVFVITTNGAL